MKIRLALLDTDSNYLRRMSDSLMNKFSDRLEIYSFTNLSAAAVGVRNNAIDVLVSSGEFTKDLEGNINECVLAYFTESIGIKEINDRPAVCKYQRVEDFYHQILDIYADSSNGYIPTSGNGAGQVVMFTSPCGGTGTSSLAAAFAIKAAAKGKSVIYLCLESFGDTGVFFNSQGSYGMSDVVFAVKSRKSNLRLKLESAKKKDKGVCFFPSSENALDIIELTQEERVYLISELQDSGAYDLIVLDEDFGIDSGRLKVMNKANRIVWVSDGTETANAKVIRAVNALKNIGQQNGNSVLGRISIIYNKYSNKLGKVIQGIDLTNLGGAPRYEHAPVQAVLEKLSENEALDKLL